MCIMFRKGIFFIYEKFYCGDRVPLDAVTFAFQDARVIITNMTMIAVMVITPVTQSPYLF